MKPKTQIMNRILSLVLSIVMVVSMLPMTAFAAGIDTRTVYIAFGGDYNNDRDAYVLSCMDGAESEIGSVTCTTTVDGRSIASLTIDDPVYLKAEIPSDTVSFDIHDAENAGLYSGIQLSEDNVYVLGRDWEPVTYAAPETLKVYTGYNVTVAEGETAVFVSEGYETTNNGTILAGYFSGPFTNHGVLAGGHYSSGVTNSVFGVIKGGTYSYYIKNSGKITGGVFTGEDPYDYEAWSTTIYNLESGDVSAIKDSGATIIEAVDVTVNFENLTFQKDGGVVVSESPHTDKTIPGEDYSFTLTAGENYAVPDSITVTVGGTAMDPNLFGYYVSEDSKRGEVYIGAEMLTGDMVITAAGYVPVTAPVTKLTVGDTLVADKGIIKGPVSGAGWSYDVHSNTLTLTDAAIAPEAPWEEYENYGIYCEGDLNLAVNGTNTISVSQTDSEDSLYGINVTGNLHISGTGTLNISTGNATNGYCYGIYTAESITVDGPTLDVSSGNNVFTMALETQDFTLTSGSVTLCSGEESRAYDFYSYSAAINGGTLTLKKDDTNKANMYCGGSWSGSGTVIVGGKACVIVSGYLCAAGSELASGADLDLTGVSEATYYPDSDGTGYVVYVPEIDLVLRDMTVGKLTIAYNEWFHDNVIAYRNGEISSIVLTDGQEVVRTLQLVDGAWSCEGGQHAFGEWGKYCAYCNAQCPHTDIDEEGFCTVCGRECPHDTYDENGRCTACGALVDMTVTFDYNGGIYDYYSEPEEKVRVSLSWGEEVTLGAGYFIPYNTEALREGYSLTGWNTEPDGTGTDYGLTGTFTAQNMTIYAQWEKCAHENHTIDGCDCGLTDDTIHTGTKYVDNGDGTHDKACTCGKVLVINEAHSTTADGDKPATCANSAYCSVCESCYGEADKTKHDADVAYVNGFCENGCYEPAVLVDGMYQISNAGNLYWFADKVVSENAAYGSADAILTADITVNENVLAADGTANAGTFREWMPIGKLGFIDNKRVYNPYTGTFEGNGKTVSGLYFNDTSANFSVGLFSVVGEGGKVQNVGVADSYLCGNGPVGAVAGNNYGSVTGCYHTGTVISSGTAGGVVGGNSGTVTNCYNSGTVSGESNVGGVVGGNSGTATNCTNSDTVSGEDKVGGVVGYNSGTATNCTNSGTVSGESSVGGVAGDCIGDAILVGCYNSGTVSGKDAVGGVAGYNNAAVTNCYFDSTVYTGNAIGTNEGTATNVEGKSTEQFASGEVAYLLSQGEKGDIWGQTIGTDPAPIFSDAKVYYGYRSCGDTEAGYTNEEATEEKPAHTQQPAYTDNHDGTHSAVYPCCGTTVSPKPHAMDTATGKCVCGLEMAEASVTMGFAGGIAGDGITTYYETLREAISAVSTATADDNATVTLLKDNNAGQNVYSGVFTLDLNGKTLSSVQAKTTLNIYNATVTITDTLGGGEITGQDMGLNVQSSTLTIINTAITATEASGHGVYTSNCAAVTIRGGTISGASQGVSADSGNLTIIDAEITATGESGYGVNANNCTVTIEGGTISGGYTGVNANGSNLTIKNAEVTCSSETGFAVNANHCAEVTIEGSTIDSNGTTCDGVLIYNCTNAAIKDTHITVTGTAGRGVDIEACTLTIQDCTVTSEGIGVVAYTGSSVFLENSTVTGAEAVGSIGGEIRISGGSVTGSVFDLVGNVKLMLPASGTGTTFPGGITVTEANLDSILGEGAAYWQGSKMIVPEDGQQEITGGDVTIQKACDHQGNTNEPYADNGDGTHSLTCSVCYAAFTEEHTQPLAYVNLEDEGHKAFYPCCQKAEDVAVSDHEYEGGYCACEDEQEFTLSFYANWGDQLPVATFSVPYGTELTMWESDEDDNETFLGATAYLENLISQITTVPQKEHYTFSGWDLEFGPIDMFGDESIYGLWTPVSYNITWDLAGGYADYPDELITTMRYNEGIILFTDFHKEGHTFSHLVDQNGLEFTREWRSDHWSLDPLMPGYDLTLTAVWDVNAYALHAQDQVLDVDYGTNPEDALADITPEKTGYTHTGWTYYYLDDEGVEQPYTGTTMPAMELYAQPVFTPIEYNITWDMAGCSYYVSNYNGLPMKLAYNVDGNAHSVNFVELTAPAGYEFVHFEDGDGNALSYVVTDKYRLNLTVSGDMTVKAVIQPKAYMATWESADGGSYEKKFKFGESITIPDSEIFQETFRKAGHTLTGWEGYTEGMTMPIDGVTFTAVYAVNPYTITFDSDGGTVVAPITQDYGTAITAPSAPTKDGFHFSTWDPAIPETMPGEDTVLTAIWEAHKDYTYTASGDTITAFCGVCHQVVGTAKLHVTGKTYDATPVTATVTCTMEGVDAPQITYSGNTNAGTYTASITLGDATAKADFTITPAVVTVRAEATSKIYGQGDPALNCTIQGLIGTDALSGSLSRAAGENAGSYAITVGTLANSNYIIDFIPANLTILPKTITVKADAVSKVYGQADPEFTYQAEGLVNGDKLTGELQREAGEDAGTYAITLGTLANSNYAIQFTGDKLTVTKAQQTITLDTDAVSLDCGKTAERTAQAVGAVAYSSSDASIVKVDASGKLTALKPGTVTITVKAAETGNYLPAQAGYTVTVSHKHTAAVTAPTCEDKGYTTYTCPCGDSYVADYTDALGHDYKGSITLEATCTAEGVMTYTCANDENHTYTEAIPVKAHTPKVAVEENRVEATCTEKGSYEMATYCGVCGKELGRTQHTIDAIGHDYDDVVITTQPDCENEGVKTYTCANDKSHTYTEKVAPTGHTPKAAVEENRVEATCTEKGSYEMATYCGVCGKELGRTRHEIPVAGHSFGNWTVVKAPTCTVKGQERRDCSACDHYETRLTVALGHNYRDPMDPSCEVCGERRAVYVESIPMLRLYNPTTGEHHYTGSAQERDTLVSLGWNYEGVAWNAPVEFGDPVCRYFNPNTGDHHYTMCGVEGENLIAEGWIYEGVAWNSASSEHLPIYRLYNPNAEIGAHHYTGSAEERDNLVAAGWNYEGIGWYALLY